MTATLSVPDITAPLSAAAPVYPTLWGLDPVQLHDRFWAARGVQVVRQGEPSEIVEHAELFMLTAPRTLAIFRLGAALETLSWVNPDLLLVRLHDDHERGYREQAITDDAGNFVRFNRLYGGGDSRLTRVALTADRRVAEMWRSAPSPRTGWQKLRHVIPARHRATISVNGSVFDRSLNHELMQMVRQLVTVWRRPDATIPRARRLASGVWRDREAAANGSSRFVGNVWVGAGRSLSTEDTVVGPAVLWDDAASRPLAEGVRWDELEPTAALDRPVPVRQPSSINRIGKRAFDVVFALVALLVTLPLYPLVMLAIWLEDGRPFFFAHERESRNGRPFGCLKFRSMRKDAEQVKAKLTAQNRADGPQFFIDNDPRLTRVGRLIRDLNIDELPQFWNVLRGEMSIVGPRPSPRRENQFCPAWREARLSVRPGITGLWQVRRSRRQGLDFQEWIKYDLEYIESMSWSLDLKIIWMTIAVVLRRALRL